MICFGCGNDITLQAANRYNLRSPSYMKTFRIWKRLVVEKFELTEAANIDFDALVNNENGAGKICRCCSSALQRLEKVLSFKREPKISTNQLATSITMISINHIHSHYNSIHANFRSLQKFCS